MANMNFLYDIITKKILDLLEKGTAPWKKAWKASEMPMNLTTKIPYRGINVWTLLTSPNANTPYWLTWNQVMALKGRVKQDEAKNYEYVVFYKQVKYKKTVDEKEEDRTYPMLKYSRVYNLSQVELPEGAMNKLVPKTEEKEVNKIEVCETILNDYLNRENVPVNFGGDRAYYAPLFDKIQMPKHEDFDSDEEFYSTYFHEVAHSTGTEKRLNRFKATDSHIFGSDKYSKEELVAEMTASFLCAEAEIENAVIDNSASYIASWMKAIKEGDKNFVISAASKAQRAAEFVLNKLHTQKEN